MIYGLHAIMEAIESGKEFERIYILKGEKGPLFNQLTSLIKENRLPVHQVPIHKLNRLTRGNHQGAVAFLSVIPNVAISEIIARTFENGLDPRILVLDGVTDVRNFGALSRSALAFGFHAIVVPTRGSALIHEDAVKASAGALMKMPVARVSSLRNTLIELKNSGIEVVGITEKTDQSISELRGSRPIALVLGNEEKGIEPQNLSLCDKTYRIDISPEIDSLNVSVAGAISMYQVSL